MKGLYIPFLNDSFISSTERTSVGPMCMSHYNQIDKSAFKVVQILDLNNYCELYTMLITFFL